MGIKRIRITESQYELVKEGLECDCCQNFDYNSLKMYRGLEVPLYFIFNKNETQVLKNIVPKQYIHAIATGFGLSYEDAISYANTDDGSLVKKYAEDMKKGDKFPIGYYVHNKGDQEGRHRALAAMLLGCKEIPIVVITSIDDKFKYETAIKYKDLSEEELILQLKKDFPNIKYDNINSEDAKLDIRSLREYLKYKMSDYESSRPKEKSVDPEKLKTIFQQMDDIGLGESIELPIEIGDEVLMGKFRNKKVTVKDIDVDEYGHPTINGKKILALRIAKLMDKNKKKKEKED